MRAKPLRAVVLAPESPEVFIDDTDLVGLPAERAGLIDQCILTFGGFTMVFDLGRRGLTYIDECSAVQVIGRDFVVFSHRCFPPAGSLVGRFVR